MTKAMAGTGGLAGEGTRPGSTAVTTPDDSVQDAMREERGTELTTSSGPTSPRCTPPLGDRAARAGFCFQPSQAVVLIRTALPALGVRAAPGKGVSDQPVKLILPRPRSD